MRGGTIKIIPPLLAVTALFAITRLPSIPFYPLNIDEAIHAATAVRCSYVEELPYVGAVGNKGPLQYWTYQALFHFFGAYNMTAAHVLGAIIVALNTAMVWHMAARCFGPYSGPSAAVFYLLAMGNNMDYLSFNSELPASLPLVLAAWLVLTARQPMGALRSVLAGLLVMVAAGFRQNCLLAYPVVCLGIASLSWAANRRLAAAGGRATLAVIGGLIPLAVVLLVYARQDALEPLAFGYFGHNAKYYVGAIGVSLLRGFLAIWQVSAWLDDTAIISLLTLVGLVPIFWKVGVSAGGQDHLPEWFVPRPQGRFLAVLTLTLWVAIAIGVRFFHHYRMLDWPFSAVLAAGGWVLLLGQLRERHTRIAFRVAGTLVLVALGFRGEGPGYLARPFAPISVPPNALEIALRLRANTTPEDSLFVWGFQSQIYLLAERRMATRFAHCSPIVGLVQHENYWPLEQDRTAFVWPGSFQQMMDDLRADPPAFVVDASQDSSFVLGQYPISKYPDLAEWLAANYVYDFEVAGLEKSAMVVYRRRDRSPTDVSRPLEHTVLGHPGRITT